MKKYELTFRDELGFILAEFDVATDSYYKAREYGLKHIQEMNWKCITLTLKLAK